MDEFRCSCGKLLAKQNENGYIEVKIKDKNLHIVFLDGIVQCGSCEKIWLINNDNLTELKLSEDYYKNILTGQLISEF